MPRWRQVRTLAVKAWETIAIAVLVCMWLPGSYRMPVCLLQIMSFLFQLLELEKQVKEGDRERDLRESIPGNTCPEKCSYLLKEGEEGNCLLFAVVVCIL